MGTGQFGTVLRRALAQGIFIDAQYFLKLLLLAHVLQNVTGLSATFTDITSGQEYVAQAVSWNSHGSSAPSNNATFAASVPEGTELPVAPTSIEEVWVRGSRVNITWSWMGVTKGGRPIPDPEFTLHYKIHIADRPGDYETKTTSKNWIVLSDLKPNRQYNVFVKVKELSSGKESLQSETITVDTIMDNDKPSSPYIQLLPRKSHYTEGDTLEIKCSSDGFPAPNLNLTIGEDISETGSKSVTAKISNLMVKHATGLIECTAWNSHGQEFSHTRIPLFFAPSVKPKYSNEKSRSILSKLDVEFFCRIDSFPTANVTWYFTKEPTSKLTEKNRLEQNSHYKLVGPTQHLDDNYAYLSTLRINNVGQSEAGLYHCQGCNELGCKYTTFTLKVDAFPLPKGPHNVENCCKQQKVKPACMSACTYDLDKKEYDNYDCIQEISKLVYCTKDGADHRECCAAASVPSNCLGLCDLMIKDDPPTVDVQQCGRYSTTVLSCIQESHKVLPGYPQAVRVKQTGRDSLRISWKKPAHNWETVQKYAIYYRPKAAQRYKMAKTPANATAVEVRGLKAGVEYEVTVLAANYHGISRFTSPQALTLTPWDEPTVRGGTSVAGTALAIVFCFLLAAVIILGVVYFSRRPSSVPAFFGKLRNRHRHRGSSAEQVTFENPVYPDYERDPQIRGLPGDTRETEKLENGGSNGVSSNGNGSAWNQPDLEPIQERDSESPITPQRGLKYTQLT